MSLMKNLPSHNTNQFSWDSKTRVFTVEASTLSGGSNNRTIFSPVYDDAIDNGFVLVSQRTGVRKTCVMYKVDTSSDCEIAGWWFMPENEYKGYLRGAQPSFTVLVIND